ncbi:MAG: rubrerythrin family protein [Proteobacteria bacterium]|nr:rubrerythrin family protein [Pseudomonadota bacterium]NIS62940.1 rubrerythrin family protein [Pseudomonadota bacterium]
MSKTDENLKKAFEDECETYMRYIAFARQAEDEGFRNIALLLRATAEGETVHALNQIDALGGVSSTEENLKLAVQEEEEDFFRMYPQFIKEAQTEDRTEAVMSLTWIQQVERAHFGLLKHALQALQDGNDVEDQEFYLCTNCGFVAAGAAPSTCPVCKAPQNMFKSIA